MPGKRVPPQVIARVPTAHRQRPLSLSTSTSQSNPAFLQLFALRGFWIFSCSAFYILKLLFHCASGALASQWGFSCQHWHKLLYSCAESHFRTTPNSISPLCFRGRANVTKFPPKTSEKDLGQLWFQSYNAWFKRGRKELITGIGGLGKEKKMRKSKGGTSLRKIQWPEIPVPTHSPALGAGVKN